MPHSNEMQEAARALSLKCVICGRQSQAPITWLFKLVPLAHTTIEVEPTYLGNKCHSTVPPKRLVTMMARRPPHKRKLGSSAM